MKWDLILAACALTFASTIAFADEAKLAENIEEFKAASSELVALFETINDAATAEALAPQIDAATGRMAPAEGNIGAIMETLDPNNSEVGSLLEETFEDLQLANQSVAEAQINALERQGESK